ncbi:MAG: dNTP triphosphohydrolase [Oscillospiraceae bacterium]|nr:dNTP triphosphohydrolase [Oscillospiraceae bacterium]
MLTWKKLLCAERERESMSHGGAENIRDIRSEFRKDYHRIIGSASFRRLQDKAQVYPLYRGDFVRTRLTHSLEVSSFAGSMGDTIFTQLIKNKTPDIDERVRENCCDILECAGLIHDIGNPPFGHFGEFSIRQWFKDNLPKLKYKNIPAEQLLSEQMKADFLNFEGNAQALRVLSRLHCLIDMQTGMNLTFALLNTIIKYPTSSVEIDAKCSDICKKKMGYYVSEQELFRKITEKTGAVGCRYPLTFILESADDIAYKTADIEDAVEKGLISYDIIIRELKSARFNEMCENEEEQRVLEEAVDELIRSYNSAVELRMECPEKAAVSRWIVKLQSRLIYAASDAFCENYDTIMSGQFKKELLGASKVRVLCCALGDIAYRYAFRSEGIVRSELSENATMTFLLNKIVGAALSFDMDDVKMYDRDLSEVLSKNYIEICRRACEGKSDAEQCYYRLLFATDCVCKMTDGFAREFFLELQGVKISQNY